MIDDFKKFFDTLETMRLSQEKNLLNLGREIVPTLTLEDLLQPNDFQELEHNPFFRYEEGVLSGILSIQAAYKAYVQDLKIFIE